MCVTSIRTRSPASSLRLLPPSTVYILTPLLALYAGLHHAWSHHCEDARGVHLRLGVRDAQSSDNESELENCWGPHAQPMPSNATDRYSTAAADSPACLAIATRKPLHARRHVPRRRPCAKEPPPYRLFIFWRHHLVSTGPHLAPHIFFNHWLSVHAAFSASTTTSTNFTTHTHTNTCTYYHAARAPHLLLFTRISLHSNAFIAFLFFFHFIFNAFSMCEH